MKITQYILTSLLSVAILLSAPIVAQASASPKAPTNIKTTYRTTRSIYASWKNVPFSNKSQFKYYRVQIRKDSTTIQSFTVSSDLDAKRTGKIINKLKPNKSYKIRVRSVTDKGYGKWVSKSFRTQSGVSAENKPEVVDMHAHANVNNEQASLEAIEEAMTAWNITHQVLKPVPAPLENSQDSGKASDIVDFIGESDRNYSFLYGGTKLNGIAHILGEEQDITEGTVFPNGPGEKDYSSEFETAQEILENPNAWETRFKNRARAAAESGNYLGFGELAPLHLSYREGHPYITYPADQELMLWLSDLAAENDMFLYIHMEPTTAKLQQLANLLEHNRDTKIIWGHLGWYETDLSRPSTYVDMLEQHDNLYVAVKMRSEDAYTPHRPIKRDGTLRSAWKNIFTTYSDRVMVETDEKYWSEDNHDLKKSLRSSVQPLQQLSDQLPEDIARAIMYENAQALLGIDEG